MSTPRRPRHRWLPWVVGLNATGVLGIAAFLLVNFSRQPVKAAPVEFVYTGGTPRPTSTPLPTSFYLPTVTPNPLSTPIEDYSTPTPFVFTSGPGAAVVGFSVEGRPIEMYSFGQGETQYLIVAGIHGGYESNTVDLANQLIVYLSQHPELIPSSVTLYIIPDMNPDAVARGRNADARVNADGVDLNRNFPTDNWAPNWDHTHCWNDRPTTGGTYGGSEPETRAIMNFIGSHHITAMISYHSAGLGVFPGGIPWQPASKDLASTLSRQTGYPYPPIDIGCTYTGTLADWAVEHGVGAAVDMELSNHVDAELNRNLRALNALLIFGD